MVSTQTKDSNQRDPEYILKHFKELNGIFPENGLNPDDITADLKKILIFDNSYQEGHVLGAMSTPPHEFAKNIYTKYIEKNLGDRGLNPSTVSIEKDLIHVIGNLLSEPNATGNITSGGTESNIIAMYLAKMNKNEITKPNVILSEAAHYSFDKAGLMMGLELRKISLNHLNQIDITKIEEKIDQNTIALIGIAGTSSLGAVDSIQKLGDIAEKNQLFFHVDAAFGGFVLPYLEKMNSYTGPLFDFRIKTIDSMTVDPHKMGLAVNPTGALLVRPKYFKAFHFNIPYLSGGSSKSLNLLGTRPGASVISFWALLKYLGISGYAKIIDKCWRNTIFLHNALKGMNNIEIVAKPVMNIIGIRPMSNINLNLCDLDVNLRELGWALGKFDKENLLRIVIMPHVKKSDLIKFTNDLTKILESY